MEFNDVIYKRRSIRKYLNKDVEDSKLLELMKYAMAAPSAINKKPVVFYIIKNNEIIEKLSDGVLFSKIISPIMILVAVDLTKSISTNPNDFYNQDASACVENILLGATNLGLSTCWIGTYPKQEKVNKVKEVLNLNENILPFALIHVGYGDEIKESRTQYESTRVTIIK